ncbi:MAG: endonuclease III [Bacilli bacterium]|nr:endonuclease III [Bacilli bacterium]
MKTNRVGEYLDTLFPDPKCELNYQKDYELLLAIVLSAQSTDKRVNQVTPILFQKYPNLDSLKEAKTEDLEEILHPIGSFRKKAQYVKEIARILTEEYHGKVPIEKEKLVIFKGVGRKTANVFLSEFYHIPAIAVDTHVERVSKRLQIAKEEDNVIAVEEKLMKYFPKEEWARRHLQLVLFGRYHCKAIKPECDSCLLKDQCKKKASF